MSKQSNNNFDDTQDAAYLVKVGFGAIVLLSALGFGGFHGYKFYQKTVASKLNQDVLELVESSQKFVDLNGNFIADLDSLRVGNKYIRTIASPSFGGMNLVHRLGGETVVGLSGMSGIPNNEIYITMKDIPFDQCINVAKVFDEKLPVIAVGEATPTNIGVNTGMFVKSNYASRVLNDLHLEATCVDKAGMAGKVNITVWATSKIDLITKNTIMGTKEGMDKKQ